jgi:hypothetical protein
MKLKILTAAFLGAFILLFGGIILLGSVHGTAYLLLTFILAVIATGIIMLSLKDSFEGDYALPTILIIIVSIAATMYGFSLRSYFETTLEVDNANNEYANIESTNKYYEQYLGYMESQINASVKANDELESKIKEATLTNQQILSNTVQQIVPEPEPIPEKIIIIKTRENEEWEDDD